MTQQEIQKACNALLIGGKFHIISNGFDISVSRTNMFVDEMSVARVIGNALYVRVVNNRNKTTMDLLNALPNVTIERDNATYKLNGKIWNGDWACVVDNLYKHEGDL